MGWTRGGGVMLQLTCVMSPENEAAQETREKRLLQTWLPQMRLPCVTRQVGREVRRWEMQPMPRIRVMGPTPETAQETPAMGPPSTTRASPLAR